MAKKNKFGKKKHSQHMVMSEFDRMVGTVQARIQEEDFEDALVGCKSLLGYLPQRDIRRAEVLNLLGIAQGALQNFPEAFAAASESLELNPRDAYTWYNRGQASLFTMRFGQAYKDYLRASELNTEPDLVPQIEKALEFSREMVEKSCKLRGEGFTLEQLIEQENLFQRGLKLIEAQRWSEGEEAFRASIALGDCLPQPWGNLATCLLMQEHFDEAEAAWKRALEIDSTYDLAQQNLKLLPKFRKEGAPSYFQVRDPMKEAKIKQTITFHKEH
jgi:tetratricopeptide (TPR) repeat protein